MQNPGDVVAFTVMMILPVVGWVVSRPYVWARICTRLQPLVVRLWRQLVVVEEPDEATLRQWALLRLERLQRDLERVRRLVADDSWMSATRQVGNRLAHEQLLVDVGKAEAEVATFGPVEVPAAPSPVAAPRFAFTTASQPAVEVIEFGPSGRWF